MKEPIFRPAPLPDGVGARGRAGLRSFYADEMLGRLARWLRLLGLDTLYRPRRNPTEMAAAVVEEGSILLTRDARLLRRFPSILSVPVTHDGVIEQLGQVLNACGLKRLPGLMSRCSCCNARLATVEKPGIRGEVPPYTYQTHSVFHRCPVCGKIYWQGSHGRHFRARLQARWPKIDFHEEAGHGPQ